MPNTSRPVINIYKHIRNNYPQNIGIVNNTLMRKAKRTIQNRNEQKAFRLRKKRYN